MHFHVGQCFFFRNFPTESAVDLMRNNAGIELILLEILQFLREATFPALFIAFRNLLFHG